MVAREIDSPAGWQQVAKVIDGADLARLVTLLAERSYFGHLLESFIIQQLMVQASWSHPQLRFWHYRDKEKNEVDCVITSGRRVWGVEIKLSRSVSQADIKGLRQLAGHSGKHFQAGIVFYDGHDILPPDDNRFLAVPIEKLWKL